MLTSLSPAPLENLPLAASALTVTPALLLGGGSQGLGPYLDEELDAAARALYGLLSQPVLASFSHTRLFAILTAGAIRFEFQAYIDSEAASAALKTSAAGLHRLILSPAVASSSGGNARMDAAIQRYAQIEPLGTPVPLLKGLIRRAPIAAVALVGIILCFTRGDAEWLVVTGIAIAYLVAAIQFHPDRMRRAASHFLIPGIHFSPLVIEELARLEQTVGKACALVRKDHAHDHAHDHAIVQDDDDSTALSIPIDPNPVDPIPVDPNTPDVPAASSSSSTTPSTTPSTPTPPTAPETESKEPFQLQIPPDVADRMARLAEICQAEGIDLGNPDLLPLIASLSKSKPPPPSSSSSPSPSSSSNPDSSTPELGPEGANTSPQ